VVLNDGMDTNICNKKTNYQREQCGILGDETKGTVRGRE
tara:strand:- start:166 stop:282 length:117 start_codon:yes stop_codon:yes gene_type:complete